MVHITALLMIKNESDRIAVTLESLNVDCIDRIAIYDTGSGDDTLDICNSFTNKEMVIKEGPWINFEFSRFFFYFNFHLTCNFFAKAYIVYLPLLSLMLFNSINLNPDISMHFFRDCFENICK